MYLAILSSSDPMAISSVIDRESRRRNETGKVLEFIIEIYGFCTHYLSPIGKGSPRLNASIRRC